MIDLEIFASDNFSALSFFRFLFDLNQVPDFAERIFCLLFQENFQESISVIDNKLNNLKMTSQVRTFVEHFLNEEQTLRNRMKLKRLYYFIYVHKFVSSAFPLVLRLLIVDF